MKKIAKQFNIVWNLWWVSLHFYPCKCRKMMVNNIVSFNFEPENIATLSNSNNEILTINRLFRDGQTII